MTHLLHNELTETLCIDKHRSHRIGGTMGNHLTEKSRGLPVAFETALAQSLPFPDATFDVALCTLALHRLPEDARVRAIDEMRRVVKPCGRVLIVEFAKGRGAWAVLHPVSLLHRRKSQILEGAVTLMKHAGFERVT